MNQPLSALPARDHQANADRDAAPPAARALSTLRALGPGRLLVRRDFHSPPEGLEGAKAVWMLVDRENARGLGITLFESEEDLRRADEALNAMSPAVDAGQRRSSVEIYEVLHRRER